MKDRNLHNWKIKCSHPKLQEKEIRTRITIRLGVNLNQTKLTRDKNYNHQKLNNAAKCKSDNSNNQKLFIKPEFKHK